jgi:hypothetical protein
VEGVSSTGEEGGDAYDGGKEKEGKEWRGVGIGMEVENKESKESKGEGKEGKGKWDKLIPVRSGPMTWVSGISFVRDGDVVWKSSGGETRWMRWLMSVCACRLRWERRWGWRCCLTFL